MKETHPSTVAPSIGTMSIARCRLKGSLAIRVIQMKNLGTKSSSDTCVYANPLIMTKTLLGTSFSAPPQDGTLSDNTAAELFFLPYILHASGGKTTSLVASSYSGHDEILTSTRTLLPFGCLSCCAMFLQRRNVTHRRRGLVQSGTLLGHDPKRYRGELSPTDRLRAQEKPTLNVALGSPITLQTTCAFMRLAKRVFSGGVMLPREERITLVCG